MGTFLVTGGAGFIGSNFVRHALRHTDDRVVVLDKLTYAGSLESLRDVEGHERYRFVRGDIAQREDVRALFADQQPTQVVNFAAESHVDRSIDGPGDFIRTNIVGTFAAATSAAARCVNSGGASGCGRVANAGAPAAALRSSPAVAPTLASHHRRPPLRQCLTHMHRPRPRHPQCRHWSGQLSAQPAVQPISRRDVTVPNRGCPWLAASPGRPAYVARADTANHDRRQHDWQRQHGRALMRAIKSRTTNTVGQRCDAPHASHFQRA